MPRTSTATAFEKLRKIAQDTDPILWAFVYDQAGELIATVPKDELHDTDIDDPGAMVALHWGATAEESVLVAGTLPLSSLMSWPRAEH